MATITLVHWNKGEAQAKAARLRADNHDVTPHWDDGSTAVRAAGPHPDLVVIDLSRMPSHGRSVAVAIRERKSTRHLPILFVDGAAPKVAPIRELLPDATFTHWDELADAIRRVLTQTPTRTPVVPPRNTGYSGPGTLASKLGIKSSHRVALLDAPNDFARDLDPLPDDVTLSTRASASQDIILLFVLSSAKLKKRLPAALRALGERGGLWIAWPKKTSGVASDLSDEVVRTVGLATGLVDNKVCAIDATWSALRFVPRRG